MVTTGAIAALQHQPADIRVLIWIKAPRDADALEREVETLNTFEFGPNQCIIFVRTFNSLHCVRPMTGKGSQAMRRSLTINIETQDL